MIREKEMQIAQFVKTILRRRNARASAAFSRDQSLEVKSWDFIMKDKTFTSGFVQNETPYCYLITRRDLSPEQQAVQVAHAAMIAGETLAGRLNPHPHFAVCAVRDERRLLHDLNRLRQLGIQIAEWREPDENNELTAFVTEPISGAMRHHFRNFQLLKFRKEELVAA